MRLRFTTGLVTAGAVAVVLLGLLLIPASRTPDDVAGGGGFLVPDGAEASIEGRLYSRQPVLLVPGDGWVRYSRMGVWVLKQDSTLLCCVLKQPEHPLTFFVQLGWRERSPTVDVYWDGELRERFESSGKVGFTIEPGLLEPGVHRIRLGHDSEAASGQDRGGVLRVIAIRAHLGPRPVLKGTGDFLQRSRLNHLLTNGLMPGLDPNGLLGGFAFYGPVELTHRLSSSGGMTFTATLQNRSASDALFRVGVKGAETIASVASEEEKPLSFRIPPGSGELTLAVEGEEHGLFFWGEPWLKPESPPEATPIILVTLDTTRRDAVSPFPGREKITPVLADFCRQSTVFSRALAVAPWTLPTHASIFTGIYPSRHGAGVRDISLDRRFLTLAEQLQAHGYFTTGYAGGPMTASRRGVAQGFCRYRDPGNRQIAGDRLTDHALACLETVRGRPVFLFINYFDPHAPYEAPTPFRQALGVGRLNNELKAYPWWEEITTRGAFDLVALEQRTDPLPPEVTVALEAAYLAEVSFMDQQLGRLLDALRRLGLYDRSLIVVVADHGEFLGEEGRFGHSCLLDPELTEVPLIIKRPGQRQPQVVDTLVSQVDIYSTILSAAGISADPGDGVPLTDLIGEQGRGRRPVILEEHHHPLIHDLSWSAKRLADHVYGTVGPLERVTVWEGGQEVRQWSGTRWVEAEGAAGWEESLGLIIGRLPPVLTSPAEVERLGDEEIRQLQLLGYLEE